jgi:hypothetical protein
MVAPGTPPCRTARAVAGKTHKRANSQLAEAAQSRSSRAKPTKACRASSHRQWS